MPTGVRPLVSVIIVNYKGLSDTIRCLDACSQLDWPSEQLELIVVDNASGDDSVDTLRSRFPHVTVLGSKQNLGFAGGCNHGAKAAKGEYIAFLNNDARPDARWIRAAVEVLETDSTVSCVASKILDWEGETIDFVDAAMSFYGHGFKLHSEEPDSGAYDVERDVLFASGAAMVIRADIFEAIGRFDERYFMFFEDVDLGWRLWILGHQVRFIPTSVVYHRHHASMSSLGVWREQYLLERNALFTIFKNYDEERLAAAMPAALMLAIRRGVINGGDDPNQLNLQLAPGDETQGRLEVSKQTLASAFAVDAFVEALPGLLTSRRALQAARTRTDRQILRLFKLPFQANCGEDFPAAMDAVMDAFDVRERFEGRRRIVVATGDALTPRMAGPAIRALQIAEALSQEHDVELVTLQTCTISHPRFEIRRVNETDMRKLERWCDVLIFQGFLMAKYPFLRESSKVIVVDVYDPFHLEQLEQARDMGSEERRAVVRASTGVLNDQLLRGDLFLCASSKQRDFWLGQLSGLGRINPRTYDEDETLESLIKVVPFGLPAVRPVHERPVVKGVVPGIGPDDELILWGGGVYNWFDPLTLIRAVERLCVRRPNVRLFFLGLKHPNPDVPEMRMAVAMRELSDGLGLTGRHVFFNEGWVPYEERQNYLLEADVGVSTHLDHVETAFSYRTRILDYIWASLPIVTTTGDALAELIEAKRLGLTVPPGNVVALDEALFRVLDDKEFATLCRKNLEEIVGDFTWSRVLDPLVQFCRDPRRAPDLVAFEETLPDVHARDFGIRQIGRRRSSVGQDLRLALTYHEEGGLRLVGRKAIGRVRNQLRRVRGAEPIEPGQRPSARAGKRQTGEQ